jgi:BON domain
MKALTFGTGLGLATAATFFLDPDRGKRRRALLRDKLFWCTRKTGEGFRVTARDFNNRMQGISSTLKSKFTSKPDDDVVIVDRVRSKLGRVVSHPHAIHVTSSAGNVTLSGPILENEVDELLTCVKRVHGVNEVTNNLEVHKQAGNHPSLQGGTVPQGSRFEFFQENWSPAARVVAGTAGAALALIGGSRKNVLGAGLSAAGLLLLARGITNKGLKELAGWDDEKADDDGQQFNSRTVRTHDEFVPSGVGM